MVFHRIKTIEKQHIILEIYFKDKIGVSLITRTALMCPIFKITHNCNNNNITIVKMKKKFQRKLKMKEKMKVSEKAQKRKMKKAVKEKEVVKIIQMLMLMP